MFQKGVSAIKKTVKNTASNVDKFIQEQKNNQTLKKAVEGSFTKLFLQGDGKSNKEVYSFFDVTRGELFFPLTHDISNKITVKDIFKNEDGNYIKLLEKDTSELHNLTIDYKAAKYEVTCIMFKYKIADL